MLKPLSSSDKTLQKLKEVLGIDVGETTPDGMFTLEEVECLAACDKAPVLLVNATELHENVTPDKVERIITELRQRYANDGNRTQDEA